MREDFIQKLVNEPLERPRVIVWFFRWCWLALLVNFLACAWSLKDGYFPSESILEKYPDPTLPYYVYNKVMGWAFLIFSILFAAPLALKSRPITYLIGWGMFALLLLNVPMGTMIAIAFITYWRKPETREYFLSQQTPSG